jgi:hypothetical protein
MAEGLNVNHCSEMFVNVPDSFTLARMRQLIGRVCRQSSLYSSVDVYLSSDNPGQMIRARLCGANFSGYDLVPHYLDIYDQLMARGISLDSLTYADLFVLFMSRTSESNHVRRNKIPRVFSLDMETIFELKS